MSTAVSDSVVKVGTADFVRSVCSVFRDMMNVEFHPELHSRRTRPLVYVNGFTAITRFSGTIHGEFLISTDELTAAKIAGVFQPDDGMAAVARDREMYASMMCEVINVSAHLSIGELSETYGQLVVLPPSWVVGEYHMASYISGMGIIDSLYGSVQCCLALNLAGFEGGRS